MHCFSHVFPYSLLAWKTLCRLPGLVSEDLHDKQCFNKFHLNGFMISVEFAVMLRYICTTDRTTGTDSPPQDWCVPCVKYLWRWKHVNIDWRWNPWGLLVWPIIAFCRLFVPDILRFQPLHINKTWTSGCAPPSQLYVRQVFLIPLLSDYPIIYRAA